MWRSRLRAVVDFVRLAMALLLTACATMPAPRAAGPCADQTLSIYFADNSAELTAPAKNLPIPRPSA